MKPILLLLLSLAALRAQEDPLVDRFFDEAWFPFHPTEATSAGFHQYDDRIEDYSASSIRRQVDVLRRYLTEFQGRPPSPDRDLVISHIEGALLDLEQLRGWERNPDVYSGGATASIFVIMSRKFAPAADRMKSAIARERAIPGLFDQARANLKNPPRIYTEIALEQLPGIVSFFQKDVPLAFASVRNGEFDRANAGVIDALRRYEKFLREDLLPRSRGDFRIGADNYRKKLLYDEMVDLPIDRLLEIGYDDLHRNQAAYRALESKLGANAKPEHPAPGNLLDAVRNTLDGLRKFIAEHHIVTIPSPVLPIVEETPPFMRALTMASMDTPGPYEKVAKEAFFNITLPENGWPAKRTEEHMQGFTWGTIASTAIHEAYPGHYTQFLWVQRAPSKVRKLIGAGSNAEGWAHYCEQMMLDEGYGNGDPKLRLGQLQDALLRDARYIVGIEMHTGKMTYEQGIDFFVQEGFQSRANGERETKRGTADPTYLVYTLGKLEILKLREDYRKAKGGTLQDFHDGFLSQGFPPIKIVREAMLRNNSPVL